MDDCVFCKIIKGELPSHKIFEDNNFVAILDINPAAAGHTLLMTKKHYENIFDLDEELSDSVFTMTARICRTLKEVLRPDGINILQNSGIEAGQTVSHFHLHLIPRFANDGLKFAWKTKNLTDEEISSLLKRIKAEI
jgi:histidine triad (HIT) family protein